MPLEVSQVSLMTLRSVLAAMAAGETRRSALSKRVGVQRSELTRALLAAEVLELVTREGNTLSINRAGIRLVTDRPGDDYHKAWKNFLETSKSVSRIAPRLMSDSPPPSAEIAKKIAEHYGLTRSHADALAATVRGWRDELMVVPPEPTWFEIENFKSIKHLRLELRPLMVFVGPNGAGKTNILQALTLCLDLFNGGVNETIELHGGYDHLIRRAKQRSKYIRFAISTVARHPPGPNPAVLRMTVDIRISAGATAGDVLVDREELRLSESGRQDLVVCREQGAATKIQQGTLSLDLRELDVLIRRWRSRRHSELLTTYLLDWIGVRGTTPVTRLRLDASALRSDAYLQGPRHGRLLGLSGEGLPLAVETLRKDPDAFQRALAGLQEVYPRIEDVDTVHLLPGQVALRFKERLIKEGLGQGNVSDGVMHALALLLALEGTGDRTTLAIEEPENALHPWALRKLMLRAQQTPRNAPLLLTTHSPTLIDAIDDPAALYIVENDGPSGTRVTAATEKEHALRAILAESGQKLGEVWMDGTLGGIPESEA